MASVAKLLEVGVVVLEVFETIQDLFQKEGSNDILSVGDSLMFLTSSKLGFSSRGALTGSIGRAGQMILQLSELILIGIVLFFVAKCLFGYLFYKKAEVPWRFFLRLVIVGILAGGAHFICFGATFFTENVTAYIQDYLGKEKTSFSIIEEKVKKLEFKTVGDEEIVNFFDADNVVNLFAHFYSILASFSMAVRYFLLQILILFSPVFILFLAFKETKPVFICWLRSFLGLLSLQIFAAVLLGIFSFQPFGNGRANVILLVSCLFLIVKMNYLFFLKGIVK